MNVSTEAVADFLSANGIDTALAPALVEHLRADAHNRGQKTDTRNIHDYLKSLSTEEIKEDLSKTRSGFVGIFYNVLGDFNLSSAIRNGNWYNTRATYIVGRKKWDRRGAVGTHNYSDIRYSADIDSVIDELRAEDYRIVAAEINDNARSIHTYPWEYKTAVIFGEEGAGVPESVLDRCDDVVYIPGRGSVRSLNVATTAGIFMHDYTHVVRPQ